MSSPKRIQRKRTKGWRMPDGAVYVGRGTKWGNPYLPAVQGDHRAAVDAYRVALDLSPDLTHQVRFELGGKDLACWCGLDQICHADVLLHIANAEVPA